MIIGLVGISGVGKSFFKKLVLEKVVGLASICQVTLRPQRSNEINGADKYFVSENEFNVMQQKNELISIQDIYGIKYAFKKNDVASNKFYITEMWYKDILELQAVTQVQTIYIYSDNSHKILENLKVRYGDNSLCQKRVAADKLVHVEHEKMLCDNVFNYQFENMFDDNSVLKFIALIENIVDKGCKSELKHRQADVVL